MGLPAELTRLIGRHRDAAEVRGVLGHTRLLTLAGPGDCGKTRLALRVARECAPLYPDGVWWVDLAPTGRVFAGHSQPLERHRCPGRQWDYRGLPPADALPTGREPVDG